MKGRSLLLPLFLSLGIHGLFASFLLPSSPRETLGDPLTIEVVWAKKETPSLLQDHKKTKKKKAVTASHAKRSSSHENKRLSLDCFTTTKAGSRTDEVSMPRTGPLQKRHKKAHHPLPPYPWVCRKRNQEGVVSLKVITNEDGHVLQVALQKSSGHERLDKAALQAIKSWVFGEGKLQKIVQIAFRLDQGIVLEKG